MVIGIDGRVISWHIGSGLSTYTSNLLKNIKQFVNPQNILVYYPYKSYIQSCSFCNLPNDLLLGERRKDFWANMYYTNWKLETPLDLFHNTVNGIGLPNHKGSKNIITLHDLIPYIMPETVDRLHLDYTLKYTPYIIENAAHIITVSNHSKKDIQRYFGVSDDNISVTYLAASDIYKPMDRQKCRDEISKKYGVNKKYILYLGGFSYRKNISRLIKAFKKVIDELGEQYELLILGEPSRSYDELSKITEGLKLSDSVKFLNFIPTSELPIFYNGAEVFAYPSLYEGFGLPPLEAMQCGTPVVTSNISSIPEIVGDACVLVNPYEISQISEALIKLLYYDDLRAKYSKLGIEKAKEYSWTNTAVKTFSIYNSCL